MNSRAAVIEPKDFYYLRHGETDWNREYRGMGQKDIPLNEAGIKQAQRAAVILSKEEIGTICYSPLERARVTAEIISAKVKSPLVEIPELIECCWGENEGLIKGQWVDDWISGVDISGAETYQHFLLRALGAVNKSLKQNGPVLIVAHGGTFWSIQHFCGLGRYDLRNATPVYLRAPSKENIPWGFSELAQLND